MFLKTKNGIYNLNTGSLYILDVPKKKYDYDFYGSEVVYNTTGNSQLTDSVIYRDDREWCEKFLQAVWTKMRKTDPNGFIDIKDLKIEEEDEEE